MSCVDIVANPHRRRNTDSECTCIAVDSTCTLSSSLLSPLTEPTLLAQPALLTRPTDHADRSSQARQGRQPWARSNMLDGPTAARLPLRQVVRMETCQRQVACGRIPCLLRHCLLTCLSASNPNGSANVRPSGTVPYRTSNARQSRPQRQ